MRKRALSLRQLATRFQAFLRTGETNPERAANLRAIFMGAGFFIVLALVALGIWMVTFLPYRTVQRRIDTLPPTATHPNLQQQLELEDNARKTTTQIVLGGFGLFLLYFTWRRARAGDQTVRIQEQGHITDRFTKAIEQLGAVNGEKPNVEVRLGAIYALERIAYDSPRDHWTVMEVLTAYVRQNAPLDPDRPYTKGEEPRTDIQAILTVVGRRRTGPTRERQGQRLDLLRCRLCGVKLKKANLQDAFLFGVHLQGANLSDSSLQNADMNGSNLEGAYLDNSNLQGAHLMGANLQGASLMSANLLDAYLAGVCLEGANLYAANFQVSRSSFLNAASLKPEQVMSASNWKNAHYSAKLRAALGLPPEPPDAPSEAG